MFKQYRLYLDEHLYVQFIRNVVIKLKSRPAKTMEEMAKTT